MKRRNNDGLRKLPGAIFLDEIHGAGIANTKAHIGLLGHGARVELRNIRIRKRVTDARFPVARPFAAGGSSSVCPCV